VVGGGAIGGTFAGALARPGIEVVENRTSVAGPYEQDGDLRPAQTFATHTEIWKRLGPSSVDGYVASLGPASRTPDLHGPGSQTRDRDPFGRRAVSLSPPAVAGCRRFASRRCRMRSA
jgi:hypothetical protein